LIKKKGFALGGEIGYVTGNFRGFSLGFIGHTFHKLGT
jgi:hypothetical protein